MYFSDEEDCVGSEVDSTVTPIEPVSGSQKSHGYFLESDDLLVLETRIRKHRRDHAKRKGTRLLVQQGSSSEQSDKSEDNSADNIANCSGPSELQEVYRELQVISNKLREENKILHGRELAVKEREKIVSISQNSMQTITDYQIKQQWRARQQQHRSEVSNLEQQLREKNKENKRLKDNFDTLKLANDTLRKELETLQSQHEKLEKQSVSLQARLTNLQRKQEMSQRQNTGTNIDTSGTSVTFGSELSKHGKQAKQKESNTTKSSKPVKLSSGTYDILGVLLDWVSDLHLRQTVTDQTTKPVEGSASMDRVQDRCLKILPSLAEVLRDLPAGNSKIYLPCLQFIYWSLLNLEQSQNPQKSSLSSTLRRLGEELYKPRTVRFSDEDMNPLPTAISPTRGDKPKEGIFFRSPDLHTRFLSALIILKTLTQADVLAHVFDMLRNDLKSDVGKDLFLYYQATPIILPYLRPINKTFMTSAVDIYLQMSMESSFLQQFMESCCNEHWFRTIAMALRSPNLDTSILEKVSIILQKLSKIKSNKKYFEVYTIISVIQEMVRMAGNDSAFLSMNLKSILFNLGVQTKAPLTGYR